MVKISFFVSSARGLLYKIRSNLYSYDCQDGDSHAHIRQHGGGERMGWRCTLEGGRGAVDPPRIIFRIITPFLEINSNRNFELEVNFT